MGGGNVRIVNSDFDWNEAAGLYILGAKDISVLGSTFGSGTTATYDGVVIDDSLSGDSSRDIQLIGNTIVSEGVVHGDLRYGIRLEGGSENVTLIGNDIRGANIAILENSTGSNTITHNVGYATESSGASSVLSGQTYKDVAHGLAITPAAQQITITPKEDFHYRWPYVDNINATHFRVNLMNGTAPEDLDFGWSIS